MAALFKNHQDHIVKVWKRVLDDQDKTDWLLLGYEGQKDSLKLVAEGCYGLEELANEFNPGQVMYAFCRVLHPKTKLATFLIINWIGEGAPVHRKATSAAHQFEVNRFLKYSSLAIQARAEEDVEEENVMQQLARCATTDYDFSARNRSDSESDQVRPVGTNYHRVQAEREIDLKAKTQFWCKVRQEQEKEENERKQDEAKRKLPEREFVQSLLKQNNSNTNSKTNENVLFRERQNELKVASKPKFDVPIQERESFWAAQEQEERERRAEEQKRRDEQRKQIELEIQTREASAKLLKRNFDGWSLIETNDKSNEQAKVKANENGEENKENANHKLSHKSRIETSDVCKESIGFGNKCNEDRSECLKENEDEEMEANNKCDEKNVRELTNGSKGEKELIETNETHESIEEDQFEDLDDELCVSDILQPRRRCLEVIAEEEEEEDHLKVLLAGKGQCAKAIYDYQASDDQEISFDPDDIITHIRQTFDTWWEGLGPNNNYGLFPANYVELLN